MIIDAHQHIWQYNPVDYGWMSEPYRELRRDFLPEIYPGRTLVAATVLVQARQTEAETQWLLDIAEQSAIPTGVVGWCDLSADDFDRRLEPYATSRHLRGLRHFFSLERDDGLASLPAFQLGLRSLASRGLTFDLLVRADQLSMATSLVRDVPEMRYVLDHMGNPDIAGGRLEPWRSNLIALASAGDVWCKLSGFLTLAAWKAWSPEDVMPYLDAALAAFGPERLMWGSDWPVTTCSGAYEATVEIVERWVSSRVPDASAEIMGSNAARAYGLYPLLEATGQ